ncbi:MAG TPA: HAD family hydrolase [Woeseiaceae bacterium]|nr:HAD family hydrolase [Woeseiaceae bacterium]
MKAIILDIDGTLIESMAVDTELYFASIAEVLGPVRTRDKLSDYDHVTDSGILAQLLDDNGYVHDGEVVEAVRSVFVGKIADHIEAEGPFSTIDGAVEFVDRIRASDDKNVAIATGGWRKSALLKLESAGFEIDGIPLVTGDDSPSRLEIMRYALSRIGDDVDSVTYFGDAVWDERACRRLDWNFVAVGPGLGGIESYKEVEL